MTVDGYIGGPNGEMDWLTFNWDDQLKEYVTALTEPVDCIVLGRKLAQGFIPHWAAHPELEGAEKFNSTKKVVFTRTLDESAWENTVLAKGDLADEITKLKQEDGGDLIVYGGATLVSALIRANLIDEYHLFVNPTAIGQGLSIFAELTQNRSLKLVKSTAFDCGIVVMQYEPKQA